MKYTNYYFSLGICLSIAASGWTQQPSSRPPTAQQQPQPTKSQVAQQQASQAAQQQPVASNAIAASGNPEIPWLRSATEAAKLSQATGKPILVYVRSKNCHYCDLLQQNTWQDPNTRAKVMRDMIPLKLTLEENKEAIEAMKVKGFPSVIIFSPRREYLGRIDGYVTPEQFQSQVSKNLVANQPSSTQLNR